MSCQLPQNSHICTNQSRHPLLPQIKEYSIFRNFSLWSAKRIHFPFHLFCKRNNMMRSPSFLTLLLSAVLYLIPVSAIRCYSMGPNFTPVSTDFGAAAVACVRFMAKCQAGVKGCSASDIVQKVTKNLYMEATDDKCLIAGQYQGATDVFCCTTNDCNTPQSAPPPKKQGDSNSATSGFSISYGVMVLTGFLLGFQ